MFKKYGAAFEKIGAKLKQSNLKSNLSEHETQDNVSNEQLQE
jgi:hypothetical protein